jgi:hypothetical protein
MLHVMVMCNVVAFSHKMDQNNLSLLANELLQEIFDDLSIIDCQSIRDAHVNNVRKNDFSKLYEERKSLHRYFTNNGFNGKKMMNILATTHAFLIGSRALEFFVPGSVSSKSDWNFFIEDSFPKVCDFMKSMEKIGVTWDTLDDTIYKRMIQGRKHIYGMLESIEEALKKLHERFGNDDESDAILNDMMDQLDLAKSHGYNSCPIILSFDEDDETVNEHGRICYTAVDEDTPNAAIDARYPICGQIKINEEETPITLSLSTGYGGKSSLMGFLHKHPLSITQCLITGFGAVHLYGEQACKRVSYRWESRSSLWIPNDNIRSREQVISYLQRNFTIKYRPLKDMQSRVFRNSNDDLSIKILVDATFSWNSDYWKEMQHRYLDLEWTEVGINTVYIRNNDIKNPSQELSEMILVFQQAMILRLDIEYLDSHGIL